MATKKRKAVKRKPLKDSAFCVVSGSLGGEYLAWNGGLFLSREGAKAKYPANRIVRVRITEVVK